MQSVYAHVAGTVGQHEPQFERMLRRLAEVQKQAKEPIMRMPNQLRQVANEIEDYLRTNPDTGSYLGN